MKQYIRYNKYGIIKFVFRTEDLFFIFPKIPIEINKIMTTFCIDEPIGNSENKTPPNAIIINKAFITI
jgi:hypothetical protein